VAKTLNSLPPREALIEAAHAFHHRGWMLGTAGNLSLRVADKKTGISDSFWITASGLAKGQLEETDFLRIDVSTGNIIEQPDKHNRPSAETSIHRVIYQHLQNVNACIHLHSINSCVAVTKQSPTENHLALPPLEMLKGLGLCDKKPNAVIPLFENHVDVTQVANDIGNYLDNTHSMIPVVMIRDHGATIWANTIQDAVNQSEAIEFIFSVMANT